MNNWEKQHILTGRAMIRVGATDLQDDPALWSAVWADCRDQLLPEFIASLPGNRPRVWWEFDAPEARDEDETEPEYLSRLGLLSEEEAAALEDTDDGDDSGEE